MSAAGDRTPPLHSQAGAGSSEGVWGKLQNPGTAQGRDRLQLLSCPLCYLTSGTGEVHENSTVLVINPPHGVFWF